MVLLEANDIKIEDVMDELKKRQNDKLAQKIYKILEKKN